MQFIEINSRTYCVEFRSSYQNVSDYLISLRGSEPARVHVIHPADSSALPQSREISQEFDAEHAARFERDNGFPWADAVAAVRAAICAKFDADTRKIVARGILEYADPCVAIRARQLALV